MSPLLPKIALTQSPNSDFFSAKKTIGLEVFSSSSQKILKGCSLAFVRFFKQQTLCTSSEQLFVCSAAFVIMPLIIFLKK